MRNYILCSEAVAVILGRRTHPWDVFSLGEFKLKGFTHRHSVYKVLRKGADPYS